MLFKSLYENDINTQQNVPYMTFIREFNFILKVKKLLFCDSEGLNLIGYVFDNQPSNIIKMRFRRGITGYLLFHHQIATCTENVKFREVNVDLLPRTGSGK